MKKQAIWFLQIRILASVIPESIIIDYIVLSIHNWIISSLYSK